MRLRQPPDRVWTSLLAFLLLAAVASALLVGRGSGQVVSWPLAPAPPVDLDRLSGQSQAAAALAINAEAALAAGHLDEALELYQRVSQTAPHSGFADRRRCELMSALGQAARASEACNLAVSYGGSVRDLRAAVGAMMARPGEPTADEVVNAYSMAMGAQRLMPAHPAGHAALADVARRIGDGEMLRATLNSLQEFAPGDYETLRAQAMMPPTYRAAKLAGWAIVLLGLLAAVGRPFLQGRIARRRRGIATTGAARQPILLLLLVCATGGASSAASAAPAVQPPEEIPSPAGPPEQLGSFLIDDANPAAHLPTPEQANANPLQFGYLLMDLATKAEMAEKKQEYGQAVKYYMALARAVPKRSVSYGKMCRALELMGERDNGLQMCREAMGREGVRVEDYERYVRLLLDHPGAVTPAERVEIEEISRHLRADPATQPGADDVDCQLAARISHVGLLTACVAGLVAVAPKDPKTISYQWLLALEQQDFSEAARFMKKAQSAGLKPEGAARMEELMRARRLRDRLPIWAAAGVAFLCLAGIVIFRKRALEMAARLTRKTA